MLKRGADSIMISSPGVIFGVKLWGLNMRITLMLVPFQFETTSTLAVTTLRHKKVGLT